MSASSFSIAADYERAMCIARLVAEAPALSSEQTLDLRLLIHGTMLSPAFCVSANSSLGVAAAIAGPVFHG